MTNAAGESHRPSVWIVVVWIALWVGGALLFVASPSLRGPGDMWIYGLGTAYGLLGAAPAGLLLMRRGGRLAMGGRVILFVGLVCAVAALSVLTGSAAYFRTAAAYRRADFSAQVDYSKEYLDASHSAGMSAAKTDEWPRPTARGLLLDRRSEVAYMLGVASADAGEFSTAAGWYDLAGRIARAQSDVDMQNLIDQASSERASVK